MIDEIIKGGLALGIRGIDGCRGDVRLKRWEGEVGRIIEWQSCFMALIEG